MFYCNSNIMIILIIKGGVKMSKNYREIDFSPGRNIKECVNELLEYKAKGELVFGVFNGHKLYSDTVTMDNAYREITGKNRERIQ